MSLVRTGNRFVTSDPTPTSAFPAKMQPFGVVDESTDAATLLQIIGVLQRRNAELVTENVRLQSAQHDANASVYYGFMQRIDHINAVVPPPPAAISNAAAGAAGAAAGAGAAAETPLQTECPTKAMSADLTFQSPATIFSVAATPTVRPSSREMLQRSAAGDDGGSTGWYDQQHSAVYRKLALHGSAAAAVAAAAAEAATATAASSQMGRSEVIAASNANNLV